MVALDASALIAFVLREPGHEQVRDHLGTACLSSVNLAEVLARFLRDGIDRETSLRAIQRLGIEHAAFGEADARETAGLIAATRPHGLSLGDCACLALAKSRAIPALTADRAWLKLDVGVKIALIR